MSSDVTDVWQCDHDVTLTLTLDPNKENKRKRKKKRKLNKETNIQALHIWQRAVTATATIVPTRAVAVTKWGFFWAVKKNN